MRRKYSIEDMKNIAKARGGECLSDKYLGSHTKLKFRCSNGHEFEADPGNIVNKRWCPFCRGMYKTIEDMKKIAKERGGDCLSEKFIAWNVKLLWKCSEGHQWMATPNQIQNNHWCPYCSGNAKLNIEDMRKIAHERGGECLSNEYINSLTKLKWRCKEGHEWYAKPGNINAGTWCPYCIGRGKTIDDMKKYAEDYGGSCLSIEYQGWNEKLTWRCKEGHIWKAIPNSILRGSWCPFCIGRNKTIEDIKTIAKERGGECLSEQYMNSKNKLKWKCANGHIWETTLDNIMRGTWCPYCSSGIGERICRKTFEKIFQKDFPKVKPKWLINHRGNRMELDGFNKDLKIAFEYQGIQHYEFIEQFYTNEIELYQRLEDDQVKRDLCYGKEIILIEVPYSISYELMFLYIINELRKNNVQIPNNIPLDAFDYKKYEEIYNSMILKELKQIAKEKGGECLSDEYVNAKTKLIWKCKEGHEWEATPGNIRAGKWCPICARSNRKKSHSLNDY